MSEYTGIFDVLCSVKERTVNWEIINSSCYFRVDQCVTINENITFAEIKP